MRLVVIGGLAAGLAAAGRARRLDRFLEIVVLERHDKIAWGACHLPFYLQGRLASPDDLVTYTPEQFARERNVSVRTGAEVAAIAHSRRSVALAGGEQLSYDKLILGTGARPDRSSIAGANDPRILTLHSLEDACRLRSLLEQKRPRRAAVVGAGYIGLELAEALSAQGASVVVFEARPDILGRQDPALTDAVAAHLKQFRIELRCQCPVSEVEPGRAGGESFDVVLLAAGQRPNVELAAEAGIQLGRTGAIEVNDRMETSLNGVYAAGDCAEVAHLVTGRPVYLPLGTTANKMGRVAGSNAAGKRARLPGVAGTFILKVCGLGIAVTGLSAEQARREGFDPASARIDAYDKARYLSGAPTSVELVVDRRTRRILGGSVWGEHGADGRINVVASAITAGLRIDDFEMLDLAYSPPFSPVWDPLLIAAQQVRKLLD